MARIATLTPTNVCVRTYRCYVDGVPSDRETAAWAGVLRTHAAVVPQLERALARIGLPLTWYDVLLVLNSAPGRMLTMSELGRQAVVSRERVSRVVTELVREGLVERLANPDDGRSSYAAITPAGRRRLRAAAPVYLAAVDEHFLQHLSPREADTIARALGKVIAQEDAHGLG